MDTLLLATKLSIPFVRPELTPRPRLTERLEGALHLGHRLTLLVAPAGSGKTTLVAEWLQTTGRTSVAWLSLDDEDNDPQRFLGYLAAALQRVAPQVGRALAGYEDAPQPPSLEAAVILLINDLACTAQGPVVLVLDDYHAIHERAIHEAVAFLVEHQPARVHLLIATREEPPLPLARWRARGQLTEIRAPELRFRGDETAHFLNRTMGLSLHATAVATLERRTEGWVAGLQLAAVALREFLSVDSQRDVAQWVEAFGGGHRHVLDYLMQEVLDRQAAPVRDFLVQTSILDRFNAPLCEAVTGCEDGRSMLEVLERSGLFVVPLDDRRTWYRYHPILSDALRDQLAPQAREALQAKAARWCAAQGLLPEAIAYALAAHDWPLATELIENSGVDMLQRVERATVLGWLRALPLDLQRRRPKLCLIQAWAMLYTGRFAAAEEWAENAEEAIMRGGSTIPGESSLRGEIDAMRATVAINRNEYSTAVELAQRALPHLPMEDTSTRILVLLNLGDAYAANDEYRAAEQAMDEALRMAEESHSLNMMAVILGSQGSLYIRQGQLHRAAQVLRRATELDASWQREVGQPLISLGKPLIFLSGVQYEWNDLDAALDTVQQGIDMCRQWGHVAHQVDGLVQVAWVWQARGDAHAAREALDEAGRCLEGAVSGARHTLSSDDTPADPRVRRLVHGQAYLLLRQGQLSEARRRERQSDAAQLLSSAAHSQTDFYGCTVLARLLLAEGEAKRAAELLGGLDSLAENKGWLHRRIGVLVLLALADEARSQPDSALAHLSLALEMGEPEGYVRSFLDEGPGVAALLARALRAGIAPAYTSCLLAAFPPEVLPAGAATDERIAHRAAQSGLAEPLSEREIEILRLVDKGLSNQQIADRLYITLGTTKWHLNNIYGKLGVASRTQAVAMVRRLKLI